MEDQTSAEKPAKVTVLIAAGRESDSTRRGLEIIRGAAQQGNGVYVYLYDRGVALVNEPELAALGVPLYVCFESCRRLGVEVRNADAVVCGLVTLAGLISATDRIEAFT